VATWKGQSRGQVLGYRIFITLLRYTGLRPAYFILRFVAFYFLLFAPASFRNIFSFYHKRLGLHFWKSLAAVYRNYYVFGQVLLDKTALLAGFRSQFTFDFDGEGHLRNMTQTGTGCLLISAHIGNFEMAGHLLERLQTKVNVLMLDAEHEQIKNYLSQYTHRSFSIIPIRADGSHVFEISHVLQDQQILCMHADRYIPGSKTVSCEFLGSPTSFPTGPFYLAMKYGVPVSLVFAMKERRRHYHFYATPPRYLTNPGSVAKRQEILESAVRNYISEIECKLRQYPYQWFNYYDFWNPVVQE
jgi:predicted LPLAT superfamily acyltransferase